ncbi:MAG: 50S ribosomal protein L21 [Sweet potato little leaf phytoplasma]|uniref:Large ribosomal subunit protein bL21 n=4 Tax=Candidatus Phytoplasma TaxID=33926 RepID=A0A9K3SUX6_9MOLU|nr:MULTISPECIES: 50S ribosomal protein L21 [Phytoplasma]QLL36761.1 50S ribosomal protein L21 ['Echinacea purpurea' witches'-broom phytoplasma]WEX20571.1 MAG: 50S ribosomal protein L21 [Candidatus Phytoplasma aurantifolia]EMR14447.1 50S ribosomal protein L21 [Peanut witches'-broom phytoplasma NTU2011]MCG3566680.1 50S ribosomal protein L21 [Sesame phyllody phytoplasma]MDO7987269.1 50S ribosomal protein L21 [Sweet potato little leaf phytoplasma]
MDKFAIVANGNKQFQVTLNQEIFTDKLPVQPEEIYVFRKVLAIHSEGNSILGTPCVEGATVEAKVIKQGKSKKIIVATYKRRKKYRCKKGHRQLYTKLLITNINFPKL